MSGKQAVEMFRVIHPNYSEFHDKKSDVRFTPTLTRNAEGHQVYVAAAIVTKAQVEEFFAERADIFTIERWTEPVVAPFVPSTERDRTPPEFAPDLTEPPAPPAPGIPAPDAAPVTEPETAPAPATGEEVEQPEAPKPRGTAARSARGK